MDELATKQKQMEKREDEEGATAVAEVVQSCVRELSCAR